MKTSLIVLFLIFSSKGVWASNLEKAMALATILASEEICEFNYIQEAIAVWIDENVDPSDMDFAGDLSLWIRTSRRQFEGMSESEKTAHCRAIERSSEHYGFLRK